MGRTSVRTTVLGLSGVTTVALGVLLFAAPSAGASGGGGDTQRVRLLDDCDPVTFNAVIGPDTCVGDGDTTFDDFLAQLDENGFEANESVDGWEFKPGDVHIDLGDRIQAVNRGGEVHTFTEVAEFGGGCIGLLDLPPVPECGDAAKFPGTVVFPGGSRYETPTAAGTYKYECLIHPWMQSVVVVRADDGDGHSGHSGHG